MSKQAEREYANKVDQVHLFGKPFNDPRVYREFAVVLELFGRRALGGKVLDMGCGPGWTTLFLTQAGYQAFGVDISERMIEIARERSRVANLGAQFTVGDMEDLDLGQYDFDLALYFDCLHHCPGFPAALKRTHAHLRSGGHVLLLETSWLHRFSPHARRVAREFGVTELGFTRWQLRRALREAGFQNISFYHDPGACYRGAPRLLEKCLRLWCDFFICYPRAKNIVLAQKA